MLVSSTLRPDLNRTNRIIAFKLMLPVRSIESIALSVYTCSWDGHRWTVCLCMVIVLGRIVWFD